MTRMVDILIMLRKTQEYMGIQRHTMFNTHIWTIHTNVKSYKYIIQTYNVYMYIYNVSYIHTS